MMIGMLLIMARRCGKERDQQAVLLQGPFTAGSPVGFYVWQHTSAAVGMEILGGADRWSSWQLPSPCMSTRVLIVWATCTTQMGKS